MNFQFKMKILLKSPVLNSIFINFFKIKIVVNCYCTLYCTLSESNSLSLNSSLF